MPKNEQNLSGSNIFDIIGGSIEKDLKVFPIDRLGLLTTPGPNGNKIYNLCLRNVATLLNNHPKYKNRFRYDKWTMSHEIKEDGEWRKLRDSDFRTFQADISSMYPQFRGIKKDMMAEGAYLACEENAIDQAVNYVRSLSWDGTARLDTWLTQVYGVEDNAYHRAIASNWFKGMAARIIKPGCKFDSVLIVAGRQGCGKSTSLSMIGGDWYTETTYRADNKDFFLQFRGKLIVEFAEGETFSRTTTKQMKAVITAQVDTYREPYGRTVNDIPRRCVFAMTTNDRECLKDETGNRRFFPIWVEKDLADLKWLKENRDQLFAEALYRYETLKETMHEYPLQAAEDMQNSFMVRNPFTDKIQEWMNNSAWQMGLSMDNGITSVEVWEKILGGSSSRVRNGDFKMIAQAMSELGFEQRFGKDEKGKSVRRWFLDTAE